ncbi:hypothetical protein C4561_02945 [candidate division WWE3 bacterium]|jgi:hypothetical protein|uniref:Uncharacterized protein n=1 Tax=candidate division WWE3 bacterium TaxID=2053526 RepID=A0A3A4ZCY8_UNCKA|nr:MAG: hypothetical protein C4561_02945 [candidate division WWE3 bacterium]
MDNTFEQIKKTILDMKKVDQEMRNSPNIDWDELTKIDQKHTNILKEVVEKYGLIDIPRFGEEISKSAWLIVQHAPKSDIEFMEKYLYLMLSHQDKVSPKNTALLEDRVNMYLGKPQVYGSQIKSNSEGKMEFYSIENIQEVDKRRFFVGLDTLANYAKRFSPEVVLPKDYKPDPNYS